MKLDNTVTIDLGSGDPLVLNDLDILVLDHQARKLVLAKVHQLAGPLTLWRGPEYDEVGDYTQAQVENRILEVLGEDLQNGLQNLFII
jgi:hypothetical protein